MQAPRSSSHSRAFGFALLAFAAMGVFACVALGEAWLRHKGTFLNYWELNGLPQKGEQAQARPWFWTYPPNAKFDHRQFEFSQTIVTNANGLAWPPLRAKTKGEKLVVILGDSFTFGIGDTIGQGYPDALERLWKKEGRPYRVINAGVPGSDPIFSLVLLEQELLRLKPDIVVLAINGSDISDLQLRGGFKRQFDANGYLLPHQRPPWAPLFDHSHLVRALVIGVLGYDWHLETWQERKKKEKTIITDLAYSGYKLNELGKAHNFHSLVLFLPLLPAYKHRQYSPELVEVIKQLRKDKIEYADMLPVFLSRIGPGEHYKYFWKLDSHYQHSGYLLVAETLHSELRRRGWAP